MDSPPLPFASWTPTEGWLGSELARRGLVARIDGGSAQPAVLAEAADPGAPFRVEHVADEKDIRLRLHLRGRRASLSLTPTVSNRSRWRRDWMIEIWRSAERWVIGPGEPAAEILDPGREPLWGRLLTRQRFLLARGPESAFRLRLEDRSFYRNTIQSSGLLLTLERSLSWAAPTRLEVAPWWQIDLGHSYFLPEFSLDLADLPPGACLRLRGCSLLGPTGDPPAGALSLDLPTRGLQPDAGGLVRIDVPLGWVARFLRVELRQEQGEPVALSVAGCEAPGVELFGNSLLATWNRTLALFRDRVMFAAREGDSGPFVPLLRYGEVARQASALARGLAYFLEDSGTDRIFLALATRSRPEWIMADLAAIERGYVVVPISPDEPDERLASILARCRPAAMLVEQADVARLAALVTRVCPSLTLLVVCGAPENEAPRRPDAAPGGESSAVSEPDGNGQEGPVQVRFEDLVWQGQTRDSTPPPAPRTGEDLYSLLFTSGSTGEPKGAMRSYAAFHAMLASYGVPQPAFHLSFQPLSHLSERMYLPAVLIHGGTVAFSRGGAFLMDELHAFEPTVLGSVPRLFDVLHARFLRRLAASGAPEGGTATEDATRAARQEAREAFGRRLMALSVGSAPVSPVVLAFLRQTFADIWVTEGYGTTEVGSITGNGQLSGRVRLKLVPLPGEAPANPARGEIWVHSPHTISGYFEDPEATAAALDADGFFRTGDLGERLPDGAIRVIGRLRSAVKLAHGEFVSAERTESALCTAPVVDRIFVLAEPGASGAAALVFPDRDALAALLDAGDAPLAALVRREEAAGAVLAALQRHGTQAGLAPHELPREVVLDPVAPSVEAGLLTASGKLARAALAARLAARLAGPALVAEPVAALPPAPPDPTAPAGSPESALAARLARAATATLGRPVSTREPLASSLDSLAAAALLAALAEDLQQPVPLPLWFACASLADLAGRLSPTWPRPAADDPLESALARAVLQDLVLPPVFSRPGVHPGKDSDLSLPIVAKDPALSPPVAPPAMDTHVLHPGAVLLTGATGFLGVHLIESLLARTSHEVICLVRGADEAQASGRLRGVMARHGVADSPRIRVVAGDLSRPRLGLTEPEFAALAGRVGAVLHAGAEVSWLAPYAALRGANVDGSRTAHSLALLGRVRPFHLVSTISTAPAAGEEDSLLSLEQSLHGSPYAVSKWVAEQHARRAMAAGYPVAIYRPAMIAPHSRRGVANPKDFLHRYLTGSLALGLYLDLPAELLDMTPVDFVADAIVALLSASPGGGDTYHLVNIEQSLSYTEIGRALARAGLPLRPADYTSFRAALLSAGPQADELRALASFFPATGFSLGMGPWPSARTRHRLAGLGVRCPAIDAAYLLRLIGR